MRVEGSVLLSALFVAVAVAACSSTPDAAQSPSFETVSPTTQVTAATSPTTPLTTMAPTLVVTRVGSGFDAPVLLVADPGGGEDLVVEQGGKVVRNDAEHTVMLDISGDALFGGEQGLLGLAFHPRFRENGLAYVNYVEHSGSTTIEEFIVVDGTFDVSTRRRILAIDQPAANHNGGMIVFGPDGYLWIGMGDGGGANDRFEQAQDPHTLLGAMLRIDVDLVAETIYGIPPDNPFADGVEGAPEVWATGLRNPWRFSFDGDDLWIADVGQGDIEEVNFVDISEAGLNFGWPIMEGTTCFESGDCDPTPFVAPVTQYSHGEGCSITGGYVYRGSAIPGILGQYFYSDFCSGFLRSSTSDGTVFDWTEQTGEIPQVSGFGVGGDGELYVVSHTGSLFRLEESP